MASRNDFAVTTVGVAAGFGWLDWVVVFLLAAAVLVGLGGGNWIVGNNPGVISASVSELVAFEVGAEDKGATTFCIMAVS